MKKLCGHASSYLDFPGLPVDDLVRELSLYIPDAGIDQVRVWRQTVPVLQNEVKKDSIHLGDKAAKNNVILEYQLPREGGRRPDFILLREGQVIVIECKQASAVRRADLDQVIAYARDLSNYHSKTHGRDVIPVLALEQYSGGKTQIDGVSVTAQKDLAELLKSFERKTEFSAIDCNEWLEAEYEPLPGLVEAARRIFNGEPLPQIKRARAAKIPETVDYILELIKQAKETRTRKLILVSGVPGAGKTLVGLQVVHDPRLETLRSTESGHSIASFLSGNAPLVRVLQDALGTNTLVSDMKKFVDYYAIKRKDIEPPNNVIIFDEAQRAWDQDYFLKKHHTAMSEPEALLDVMERTHEWGVIIGLVGEGQEIHSGEEAGIQNWIDTIIRTKRQSSWETYGSEKVAKEFARGGAQATCTPLLNLDTSLRSHLASHLHDWVAGLVGTKDSSQEELSRQADNLRAQGFCFYITQDLDEAREYVRNRYAGVAEKKYGLLASRYAKNLVPIGLDNVFHFERVKQLDVAKWFNAPTGDPLSCTSLIRPATEFESQGLELEMPIICWGDDFFRESGRWSLRKNFRHRVDDQLSVRKNSYRVLLTRGRDGMIVFVPNDKKLNETILFLTKCGMRKI